MTLEHATQKIALITGASQRIGLAMANALHTAGYNIILHYRSSQAEAEKAVSRLNELRENSACSVQADLSNTTEIKTLCASLANDYSRLDVLINNASLFTPDPEAPVSADAAETHWNLTHNTNARAAYLLSTLLRPLLKKGAGAIINITDIYAERPLRKHSAYSSSKAAIAMLTKSLALEFAPDIRVNGIAPGAILWPENPLPEAEKQHILARIPLGRAGSTDDICHTLHYLLNCHYLTGQIISVDGGRSITI